MALLVLVFAVFLCSMNVFVQALDYEILRDVRQDRHDLEADRAREQQLEKSEHVRETAQRPPLPPQQPIEVRLQERLVLIGDQVTKLQQERAQAVQEGKTAEEITSIDTKIKELQRQGAALRAELGLPETAP